jgi:hypothetical protein
MKTPTEHTYQEAQHLQRPEDYVNHDETSVFIKVQDRHEMGSARKNPAIARFPDTKKRPNVLTPKTKSAPLDPARTGRGGLPCHVRQAISEANNPKSTKMPAPAHSCGLFSTAKVTDPAYVVDSAAGNVYGGRSPDGAESTKGLMRNSYHAPVFWKSRSSR